VLAVRALRTWDAYPFTPAAHASFASSYYNHVRALEYVVQPMLLAVICLAVVGGIGHRRRGGPLWPFLAPIVMVMLVTLAGYGDPRFRHAADVALVVLAGVGISFASEARRASRTSTAPGPRPGPC
jgi:predicted membrane protein